MVPSIWQRLGALLQAAVASGATLLDGLTAVILGDEAHRRGVAFTVAVVALSAKMARADGIVTDDEVAAFRRYFAVAPDEENNVRRLFRLAQGDVAGFEHYAARIAALFADEPVLKEDVLDGLFLIAAADGFIHQDEAAFLEAVAAILGLSPATYGAIRARHMVAAPDDPYVVLGIDREATPAALKAHYRDLVRRHHPDSFIARGLPLEFVRIANERLAAINAAFSVIARERGL